MTITEQKGVAELRGELSPLLERIEREGLHVIVKNHSRQVAKIVPFDTPVGATRATNAEIRAWADELRRLHAKAVDA